MKDVIYKGKALNALFCFVDISNRSHGSVPEHYLGIFHHDARLYRTTLYAKV